MSEAYQSLGHFLNDIRLGKVAPMPTPPPTPDVYDTNYWGQPRLIKYGERFDGGIRVPPQLALRIQQLEEMYARGWHYRPPRRLSKRERQLRAMRRARARNG